MLRALFQQFGNDLVDHLIGQCPHLILGLRLDWMLYEDWLVLWHAKGVALRMGGADELGRGDVSGRNAFFLEVDDIVRTARDARPSIAEGFDERVTFLRQFRL